MTYKGVIFDFNGTLFWDTELHNEAWDIFLEKHNIEISNDEKFRKLHGRNNRDIFTEFFGDHISETQMQKYIMDKEYLYMDLCVEKNFTSLAPGAEEFFDFLKSENIPFTIGTASGKENIDFYFKHLGIGKWFDYSSISYNDGTMRGKPSPDIYLKAMSLINCKAEDVVVFEDAVAGLESAKNAKAGKTIVVDSNGDDYAGWENCQIIKNFDEVNHNLFV